MLDKIIKEWNSQPNNCDQWNSLDGKEQIEFAVKFTARRCKEIAIQRYLAREQAVEIETKISREFGV